MGYLSYYREEAICVIQYPTNVYPSNSTFDPTVSDENSRITFTFNGDILSAVYFKVYDYNTDDEALESAYARSGLAPICYNGEKLELAYGTLAAGLLAGHEYVMQMMLSQYTADGNTPIYDMPILRGVVNSAQSAASQSVVMVEKDITTIYPWRFEDGEYLPTYDSLNRLISGMVIQIEGERRFIVKYQPDVAGVGMITLDSPFSFTVTAGMSYQIYSNFLITPQYYFKCRTTPTLTATMESDPSGIRCIGTYSQSEGSLIKSWQMTLLSPNTRIVAQKSPVIYSQKIDWKFTDFLDPTELTSDTRRGITVDVITQDDISISTTVYEDRLAPIEQGISSAMVVDLGYAIYIPFQFYPGLDVRRGAMIYRTNIDTLETLFLGIARENFYDYTASFGSRYKYTLIAFSYTEFFIPYETEVITPKSSGYMLIPLESANREYNGKSIYFTPRNGSRPSFDSIFVFNVDISNLTVTQNRDRVMHVGNGVYPTVTSTDVNYMSGDFSSLLNNYDCSTGFVNKDDMSKISLWRSVIVQSNPFILKSPRGDIWVVNVIDNPTTEYEEGSVTPTTRVNFAWAECCKVEDICVVCFWDDNWR